MPAHVLQRRKMLRHIEAMLRLSGNPGSCLREPGRCVRQQLDADLAGDRDALGIGAVALDRAVGIALLRVADKLPARNHARVIVVQVRLSIGGRKVALDVPGCDVGRQRVSAGRADM